MFERTLVDSSPWRVTFPLAYALEMAVVSMLVLFPLLRTAALSIDELRRQLVFVSPPPAPAPRVVARSAAGKPQRAAAPGQLVVPTRIPGTIERVMGEVEPLECPGVACPGCVPGGLPSGTTGGIPEGILWATNTLSPPPAALAKPAKPTQIRVGGQVEAAKAISRPMPDYPPLARLARVQGTVRLEALIAADGRIQNLKVLAGHPLLVGAALEAVARWRYQPTLLNGEPVEVVTEIDVNFSLAD